MTPNPLNDIDTIARQIRVRALQSIHSAGSGHPGGSLSIADMLAVLYFSEMHIDPKNPNRPDRDRLYLSKGHACPALYAALALRGYFPTDDLAGLRKIDGYLEGHPDAAIPGVDGVSGSLGMGLSQAVGACLGGRYQNFSGRSFVILGDGDMQEGNTWEAIMLAGARKLGNLIVIYDANKLQGDATVADQLDMGDVGAKVSPFGWDVSYVNGHDIDALAKILGIKRGPENKPHFIVADTIKGKGVSFMEGELFWHGSVTMSDQQLHDALYELEA